MQFALATLAIAFAAISEPTNVFVSGEDGYHTYRIPAVVATSESNILVFAEGRRDNGGDPGSGDIDLVCKQSTDGGKTWSAMRVLDDPGEGWGASNPTPVVDRESGGILLLYNRWKPGKGTKTCKAGTTDNTCWLLRSEDGGEAWSAPEDITAETRNIDDWRYCYFGPGGATQMEEGRIIVPAAGRTIRDGQDRIASYVVYSDDGGDSWTQGALSWYPTTNECQVIELFQDYLLMNARQVKGERNVFLTSSDRGLTWGLWVPGMEVTPVATAIESVNHPSGARAVVWTGPKGPGRKDMAVHVDGDFDQYFENAVQLQDLPAAYSDLDALPDGSVAMVWETGDGDAYERIVFTRIPAESVFE